MTADVVEIRARATVMRTNDDIHLIVPNAKLTETVVNRSFDRRVYGLLPVGVGYDSDPREVEPALLEAAARCEEVLADLRRRSASRVSGSPPWTSSCSAGPKRWLIGPERSSAS